jgi:copper chaperone
MLDEQQDTTGAVLNEEDIRRIVRSEVGRADQPETAAIRAAVIASKGTPEVDTPHRYHYYPAGVSAMKEDEMPETAAYRVPGMSCEHCERAVSEELTALTGVESVAIDLDSKIVKVSGASLDDAALRSAIVEAGYEAE